MRREVETPMRPLLRWAIAPIFALAVVCVVGAKECEPVGPDPVPTVSEPRRDPCNYPEGYRAAISNKVGCHYECLHGYWATVGTCSEFQDAAEPDAEPVPTMHMIKCKLGYCE